MNIKQARLIQIRNILASFSLFPSKENSKTVFYFAVDREEKTPSLSVDFVKNSAFDFGTGKKYDNISLVQAIKLCTVSEALKYLSQFQPSIRIENSSFAKEEKKYFITENKPITHPALIRYLEMRKVLEFKNFLSQLHYTSANGKNYFGVAFGNNSGNGWEFSNPIGQKICLGSKDITTIHTNSKIVRITESFWDYFSILKSPKLHDDLVTDYIILNSTALYNKLPDLSDYSQIHSWLDRDKAGQEFFERLNTTYKTCLNYDFKYSGWKDANDWLQEN